MFYLTLAELAREDLVNSKIYISRQCLIKKINHICQKSESIESEVTPREM